MGGDADSWPCDVPSPRGPLLPACLHHRGVPLSQHICIIEGPPSPSTSAAMPHANRSPPRPHPQEVCSAPITLNPQRPATKLPRAPTPLTSWACGACNSAGWLSRCSASFSERLNFNLCKGCFFPHDFNSIVIR